MLKIPAFKHPSNASLVTTFKEPDVDIALNFLGVDPNMEEKITTDYLNAIIVKTTAPEDSADWTASDRRTALWWVFINIMPDNELTFTYECEHCGELHIEDINLLSLDDEITTLKALPALKEKIKLNGALLEIESRVVTGRGAETLNEYRVDLLEAIEEENEPLCAQIRAEMKIVDAALHLKIETLDVEDRIKKIKSLSISEMLRLFVFVETIKQEKIHGLHMQLTDGKYQIVSPPLLCQSKDNKEGVSSRLLINFRSGDFIPTI